VNPSAIAITPMKQSTETKALIFSAGICALIIGGAAWWFFRAAPLASTTPPAALSSDPNTVATFADVSTVPRGVFRYGGSTTWSLIRAAVLAPLTTAHPDFQLTYADPWSGDPSSGSGIEMLLQNQLSFAMSSRSILAKEHEAAQTRGMQLTEIPVAIDGYAIAVHLDLPILGLTLDQVNKLQAREYTNWQEVGGPDLPIRYYVKRNDEDPNATAIKTTTEAIQQLATDPGGVYWASAPLLAAQCMIKTLPITQNGGTYISPTIPPGPCPAGSDRQVNTAAFRDGSYPLTRRLTIVIKQDGTPDQVAGEAYAQLLLTDQGQSLIREAGFVSLR
jgi:phosphate transport system substrate-binding protein